MPSNYTPNYQLNQWEAGDKVERADFNADNAKIDAALAGKADAAALSALSQAVAGKGNCQVVYGHHIGNGLDTSKNPVTLTFDKKPMLVLVVSSTSILIAVRGAQMGIGVNRGTSNSNRLTWTDNSVSWTTSDSYDVSMNSSGVAYPYVAFLEA